MPLKSCLKKPAKHVLCVFYMLRSNLQASCHRLCVNIKRSSTLKMAASQASSSGAAAAGTFTFKGSMDKYASLEGLKRESPAAERNKQPILDVLLHHLPRTQPADGTRGPATSAAPTCTDNSECDPAGSSHRPILLEVASGSGQHAAHIAAALPEYDIQPSDVTPELFGSIAAYAAGRGNIRLPPLLLDASAAEEWPSRVVAAVAAAAAATTSTTASAAVTPGDVTPAYVDAILCANMCHISPLAATRGLLRGAGTVLRPGSGLLFVYGPFTRDRAHTSESNAAFDASLRARNPEWGYRDLGDMAAWAAEAGLAAVEVRDMPANNFMLVFRRGAEK